MNAPVCPVSFGGVTPGKRVLHGDPWTRPGTLQDMINRIPRAHDLPSAVRALNIMSNIITQITRGTPQVNNVHVPSEPSVKLKGEDFNPNYEKVDWVQEGREYVEQKLRNPDNPEQYIKIKTLKTVYFFNPNTNYRLIYYGPVD